MCSTSSLALLLLESLWPANHLAISGLEDCPAHTHSVLCLCICNADVLSGVSVEWEAAFCALMHRVLSAHHIKSSEAAGGWLVL